MSSIKQNCMLFMYRDLADYTQIQNPNGTELLRMHLTDNMQRHSLRS